ncbi:MAG: triose-phosphate isomerase [archaeon]
MKPLIIINLKTYKQGIEVIKLAKIIENIDDKIIVGAQATDIYRLSQNTKLQIFCQHSDFQDVGRNTGFILPEAIKSNGAKGVFLNHSEHRIKFDEIKKTIIRCKKIGLKTAIFVNDLKQALEIKKLKPDYLIIEPPELVAGKVSVSKSKPELIKKIKEKLKYDFIVGAGIKTNEDIEIAMKLGAKGIAVSSAITQAKNPAKKLREFLGK